MYIVQVQTRVHSPKQSRCYYILTHQLEQSWRTDLWERRGCVDRMYGFAEQ